MQLDAEREYHRIRRLTAFNVEGGRRDCKNQHCTRYVFPDGSRLAIHRKGFARVLLAGAVDFTCVIIGDLRANR